ncbi:hypothetical protein BDV10DRAFT_183890 [Aspergillus recurvatus]
MPSYAPATTFMRQPSPISLAGAPVPRDTTFDDVIDDPFFSGTSFPSPGIASPEREPAAPRDPRTWTNTPIEIPEFYTAAGQLIETTHTSTASSSSLLATIPSPASQEQPAISPSSSAPRTQSSEQERPQDTPKAKDKDVPKPSLTITFPEWTHGSPMQRAPPSTTPRSVHIRQAPYPHPHPPASQRSHVLPPRYSRREEDPLHELHIARREIRDLMAGLVRHQNSLVGAQRKINLLTETIYREREALAIARDRIRELEYAAVAAGPGSARR